MKRITEEQMAILNCYYTLNKTKMMEYLTIASEENIDANIKESIEGLLMILPTLSEHEFRMIRR